MRTFKLKGREYSYRTRYTAGHILTAAEAEGLNKMVRKHIYDTFRKRLAFSLKNETEHRVQLAIDAFAETFDFGDSVKLDLEAMAIARAIVKQSIRKVGGKVRQHTKRSIASAAKDLLETQPDAVYPQARRNLGLALPRS